MDVAQQKEQMAETGAAEPHQVNVEVSETIDPSGTRMLQIGQITGAVSSLAGCIAAIAGMIINERLPFASDSEGHFSFGADIGSFLSYPVSHEAQTKQTYAQTD